MCVVIGYIVASTTVSVRISQWLTGGALAFRCRFPVAARSWPWIGGTDVLAEKNDADYITSSAVMVGHHSMQSEGCSIGCGQMQHVCFLPHYHVDVMYVLMQVASISDIYCNSKPSCVLISMMCRFFSQFLYTTERHCGPIIILVFLHMLLLTNVLDCVCAIITSVNRHSYNNFVVLSVGILRTSSSIGGMMLEPQMFANIAICVMLPIHCGPFFFRPLHFWTFSIQPIVILCLRWFQIFRVYVLHSFHFRLEFKSIVVHSTHRCDVSQVCDYTGICFCLLMVFL